MIKQKTDKEILIIIKTSDSKEEIKVNQNILWNKYQKQIHKHWWSITKSLNIHSGHYLYNVVINQQEDFLIGAYEEAFLKAIKAINLEKIKNDKWKFVSYFNFYLLNYKNEVIKNILKENTNERSIYQVVEEEESLVTDMQGIGSKSAEDEYIKYEQSEALNQSIQNVIPRLSSDEKEVFLLKLKGKNINEIHKKTNISYYKVNVMLDTIKSMLARELEYCTV